MPSTLLFKNALQPVIAAHVFHRNRASSSFAFDDNELHKRTVELVKTCLEKLVGKQFWTED